MRFSVFLNSRGRPEWLKNALDSVYSNCKNPDQLESLIRVDDDDHETISLLKTLTHPNLRYFIGPRPNNLIKSYNELVSQAKGQYLFVFNDDVQLLTPNWDEICENEIILFKKNNNIQDDIIYCETSDTSVDKTPGHDYCSFMIISREAVDALGYFMNESFVTLGGDSHIHRVYKAVNRIVDCGRILLDHIGHNTINRIMNPDIVAAEYRQKAWLTSPDPFELDISAEVDKLRNIIK